MVEALPGIQHLTWRATYTRRRRGTPAPMHSSMPERLITADFTVAGSMEAFMAEVMGDGDKELEICQPAGHGKVVRTG